MGWLQLGYHSDSRATASPRQPNTEATVHLGKEGTVSTHIEHAEPTDGHSKARNDINSSPAPPSSPPPPNPRKQYPYQPPDVPSTSLPTIPASLVKSKRRPGLTVSQHSPLDKTDLWIVIDDIVYDCSDFIDSHPGGRQVIASFVGEDCSWQFWRFHSVALMEEYGRPLRVGRTEGVENRFQERPRFVGLRRLGVADLGGMGLRRDGRL